MFALILTFRCNGSNAVSVASVPGFENAALAEAAGDAYKAVHNASSGRGGGAVVTTLVVPTTQKK
jgi:hypothetical protein